MVRARDAIETLLVEDRRDLAEVRLRCYNLSRQRSTDIFDRALAAFLDHPAWDTCRALAAGPHEFFGPRCPIRQNLALLGTPLVRQRLRALLALCDHNRLHLPIRQILLLLTNAVLGHPEVRDRLMTYADVPRVIRAGTLARASLYSNIFGGNLPNSRRESILAFDALNRFGIGFETSNRVDNILIFGKPTRGYNRTSPGIWRATNSMAPTPAIARRSGNTWKVPRGTSSAAPRSCACSSRSARDYSSRSKTASPRGCTCGT